MKKLFTLLLLLVSTVVYSGNIANEVNKKQQTQSFINFAPFKNNGYNITSQSIKKRLINANIFEDKCSMCNIGPIWNNEPLTLQLDHIDGNSDNNLPNNLRLLCPNCHSQTATYKGANKGNGRFYRKQRYAEGKSY